MQTEMFPDRTTTIIPSPDHAEPLLWVRRLVIWEKPDTILRDFPLKRGLNILWSPDPGGHGAGKTLFCRFIRYCLGEDTYANDEQRRQIAAEFKEGLVGAEVLVGGRLWSVIRPIGKTRKHMVGEGMDLGQLLGENSPSTGMEPFLEAVSRRIFPAEIEGTLPSHGEWRGWLLALAWASRDQENRLAHILEWRHSRSDSRASIPGMSKTDLIVVTRAFLDMISSDEPRLRRLEAQIKSQRTRAENDIPYFIRRREELTAELSRALGYENINFLSTELALEALKKAAKDNFAEVTARVTSPESTDEINMLKAQHEKLITTKAVAQNQIEAAKGLIALQGEQIAALQGKRSSLNAQEVKTRLGSETCPICFVPIDKALADGCGLVNPSATQRDVVAEKLQIKAQLSSCQDAITIAERQKGELESLVRGYDDEITRVTKKVKDIEEKLSNENKDMEQDRVQARLLLEKSSDLEGCIVGRDRAEKTLKDLDRDEGVVALEIKSIRAQHEAKLRRFEDVFKYVCAGLTGGTRASLKLYDLEWSAKVHVGGAAMESWKAIAFDLAALVLSIEGKSHLPAFWIHDSPREADVQTSYYERIFLFARHLEEICRLDGQPAFQYIVTTTTDPPPDFRERPYLIDKLDGLIAQERLLRRSLSVDVP